LLGAWLLDFPLSPFEYEISLAWIEEKLYEIGIPLYFGAFITGVVASITGYFVINAAWKRSIIRKWHQRKKQKKQD
jgi:uncharacterized protein